MEWSGDERYARSTRKNDCWAEVQLETSGRWYWRAYVERNFINMGPPHDEWWGYENTKDEAKHRAEAYLHKYGRVQG